MGDAMSGVAKRLRKIEPPAAAAPAAEERFRRIRCARTDKGVYR
jgi:hypothetical protein